MVELLRVWGRFVAVAYACGGAGAVLGAAAVGLGGVADAEAGFGGVGGVFAHGGGVGRRACCGFRAAEVERWPDGVLSLVSTVSSGGLALVGIFVDGAIGFWSGSLTFLCGVL